VISRITLMTPTLFAPNGGDAELVFHHLHEVDDLHHGHVGDCVEDLFLAGSHCRDS